jgi:hypothetical protein
MEMGSGAVAPRCVFVVSPPRQRERIKRERQHLHLQPLGHIDSQPKVGQLQVPAPVDEKVLWLEVAVDVAQRVQGMHGHEHLCDEKPHGRLAEGAVVEQVAHVTAGHQLLRQTVRQKERDTHRHCPVP